MEKMPYSPLRIERSYLLTSLEGNQYVVTLLDDAEGGDSPISALNYYQNDGGTDTIVNIVERYSRLTGTGLSSI